MAGGEACPGSPVLFLWILLLPGVVAQDPGAPPLPDLALETYPAAARQAITAAHRESTSRPADPAACGTLARLLHAWQQWEAAHQAYARASALDTKSFSWAYLDAVILQRLARHDAAAGQLRRALAIRPDYLPARLRLAEALLEIGDIDRSAMTFEDLLREPSAEPAARVGLGRIAASRGDYAAAVIQFERALTLFPELGAAHYGLARALRAMGRTAEAEQALARHKQYGARWPRMEDAELDAVLATRTDPMALLQRGTALAQAGDMDAAIALHEQALRADPVLTQAHANLVSLYARQRHWPQVEEHYRAALTLGVRSADVHYDYAVALGMQERWGDAAEAYRRAIDLNPLHAEALNNLGQIAERRRDVPAAAAHYRQAVEAQPSFRLGRFNLGRMLLAQGRAADAAAEFEKLQQPVDQETPRYLFALSTALVRSGRRDEGIRTALEARRVALAFGQTDFAAVVDRELAKLQ